MRMNTEWRDYAVVKTAKGQKLERWGKFLLLRPDPQVIWGEEDLTSYPGLAAYYERSPRGGGEWHYLRELPEEWRVSWGELTFGVKPMGFKHTGLFPEQAVNWAEMMRLIRGADRPVSVLNLFAYTGGATVACLAAGASVCHVDAARNMVERAKANAALSNLSDRPARYIVDDCAKFVEREIKRGRKYDAIVMDPPSYGRGPAGELWKIEEQLDRFLKRAALLLSDRPLFVLINSYTTGLQPAVLGNLLRLALAGRRGEIASYEVVLPTEEAGIVLPCGASGMFYGA